MTRRNEPTNQPRKANWSFGGDIQFRSNCPQPDHHIREEGWAISGGETGTLLLALRRIDPLMT
jgi:hypothetical protein